MSADAVMSAPRRILRLEGLAVFVASVLMYRRAGGGWPLFVAGFVAPDVAMLGYLAGPRVGAAIYNVVHCYAGPILLWLAARGLDAAWAEPPALVWAAHIGVDRAMGYGLKYASGFRDTHLGTIGRAGAATAGR